MKKLYLKNGPSRHGLEWNSFSSVWKAARDGVLGQKKRGIPARRIVKIFIVSLSVLTFMGSFSAFAGRPDQTGGTPSEIQVKAAYLYNFVKFVDWPESSFRDEKAPIVIGVLGEDPFGSVLDETLAGKRIRGRELAVKRFKWLRDFKPCHILYISSSEKENLEQVLRKVEGTGIVTVSDTEGFAEQGVILNLVNENDKIRFKVNIDAAQDSRARISAKLLQFTRIVTAQNNDDLK